MAVHAEGRLQIPEDCSSARAFEQMQPARTPLRIAIALVAGVAILVPILLGLPILCVGGVLFCAALTTCLWAVDGHPETFRRAGHVACFLGQANLTVAIFGFDLPPEISVYLAAITLLTAAQFLGVRASIFWGIACVALVAAASFFPPEVEREVPAAISFAVRAAALVTVLSLALSVSKSQDERSAASELRATTDPLTGLANRRELDRRLGEALLRSRRFDREGAVVFVDLDGVKRVNDSLGHAAGDELIRSAAARIAGVTRNIDTPARLGGDEFVILLSEFAEPSGGEIFGSRLLAALSEPVEVNGQLLQPSASIGVALFPAVGLDADDVLRAADDAMYHAKRAGGGRAFLRDGPELREVA